VTSTGKAILRADGDHQIGLGHIYRIRALGCALSVTGRQVVYVTLGGTAGERLLRETDLPIFTVEDRNSPYVPADVLDTFDPDVVLLDVLDCDGSLLKALKKSTDARLIVMDDTKAGLECADVAINAIVAQHGAYSTDGIQAALYEGPAYMILNSDVAKVVRRDGTKVDQARKILLSFGGTDTHNVTERMLDALNGVPDTFDIRVSLGPASEPSDHLEKIAAASSHNVHILHEVPSLIAEFAAADLVICAGGISLYELAAIGVPAAAIASEPHEVDTIRYCAAHGTCLDLGWERDMDFSLAAIAVTALAADPSARRDMAQKGPALVDGQGLRRCVELISESLNQ